jgi:hypothetical protein
MSHELVNQIILSNFIDRVKEAFPTSKAVVITDRHGLPIASKIEHSDWDESTLAVHAITDRQFLDLDDYQKVVRPLSMDTRIMVLLEKSASNLHRFKKFNQIMETENPM